MTVKLHKNILSQTLELLEKLRPAHVQTPREALLSAELDTVIELLKKAKREETTRQFSERQDVLAFHQKFNVPMATVPSLLGAEAFNFRLKFLQEELDEFFDGHREGDLLKAADALVDLAYVTHGTALKMGLPWPLLWSEVQRANMTKERATSAAQSKRGSALDVIKPPGWVGPDHAKYLGKGPWPMFEV